MLQVLSDCNSEWQLVMCGDIPLDQPDLRAVCCEQYKPGNQSKRAASKVVPPSIPRPDLDLSSKQQKPVNWQYGDCAKQMVAEVPVFSRSGNGTTEVCIMPLNPWQLHGFQ